MILAKNQNVFYNKYDFTDSIVTNVQWDKNMLDLLVEVDYFWDIEGNNKNLKIRFKNCREAIFSMPKAYSDIPKNELHSYVNSWYTITNCMAVENNGLFDISIKTIDDNPRWLTLLCDEIWLENV